MQVTMPYMDGMGMESWWFKCYVYHITRWSVLQKENAAED